MEQIQDVNHRSIALPGSRGPISATLIDALVQEPGTSIPVPIVATTGTLHDEDVQLALYLCYELHYSGIDGVDPRWEWDPALLTFRAELERRFEADLRAVAAPAGAAAVDEMGTVLFELVAQDDGPPLARFVETQASRDQLEELLIHRSAYQLKEADPHSWALPRLAGAPKAALVEIQADEYGGGDPERIHAVLFAKTMRAAGLRDAYGAYLDLLPAITLATVNLMTMCGLHRRLRGAIVGHLAVLEMTSTLPNRRYGNAMRRLGFDAAATDFFDEHVTADAVHENIAAWDLAGGLATAEPSLHDDILFGARALLAAEALWAEHLLDAWESGRSSLRGPVPA